MRIHQFLSISGRATRTQFVAVSLLSYTIAKFVLGLTSGRLISIDAILSSMYFGILPIIAWLIIATTVRRLHDMNASGWWALLLAVPVIKYITLAVLAVWPEEDDNDHGSDPRDERPERDTYGF